MAYYALTITGRAFGSDGSVQPRTRHFWLDRNGSNGNSTFIGMVRKCNTMQEVETLTGKLQMKNALSSRAIEKLAGESGKPMSIVHHAFTLPAGDEQGEEDWGDLATENGMLTADLKDSAEVNAGLVERIRKHKEALEAHIRQMSKTVHTAYIDNDKLRSQLSGAGFGG